MARKVAVPSLLRLTNLLLPIRRSQPQWWRWSRHFRRSPQICCRSPPRRLRPPVRARAGDCSTTHRKSRVADNGGGRNKIATGQGGRATDYGCEQFWNLPAVHHEDERSAHHIESCHHRAR